MIEVRNLSKSYGDKMVVHDVSLKIQKGKITSLNASVSAGIVMYEATKQRLQKQ